MRIIRGVLVSVLLWILIFVEVSVFKVALGLNPPIQWIIHYILLIPMVILCVYIYYKNKDQTNGILLGIFMLMIGIFLDLLITIPFFLKGDFIGFYSDPYMLFGFLELIIVAGIAGAHRRMHHRKNG